MTGWVRGGHRATTQHQSERNDGGSARGRVYGLLADGSTWPAWSTIESVEIERPGDDAARGSRRDPREPAGPHDRARPDPRARPEPAPEVRHAVGPSVPRLHRRGRPRAGARWRDARSSGTRRSSRSTPARAGSWNGACSASSGRTRGASPSTRRPSKRRTAAPTTPDERATGRGTMTHARHRAGRAADRAEHGQHRPAVRERRRAPTSRAAARVRRRRCGAEARRPRLPRACGHADLGDMGRVPRRARCRPPMVRDDDARAAPPLRRRGIPRR